MTHVHRPTLTIAALTLVTCVGCPVFGPLASAHAADESKKNFEETSRDLKRAADKTGKAISEGAGSAAHKLKKAFSSEKK